MLRLVVRVRARARGGVEVRVLSRAARHLHVAALGELDDHAAPAVDVADDVTHVLLRRGHVNLVRVRVRVRVSGQ